MRKKLIILTLFSVIILSSCGKTEPTISNSTPEPTATIEPTESPEPDDTAKLGTTDTGYIADTTEIQEEPELEGNGTGYHLNESENNYLAEAKALWSDNNLSEELECNEETFNETYMGLRESGKTPDEAYAEATEMFKPTPQPQPQQPAEQKPQQQQPSEQKPAEQKPAEQKPAEQPQQPSNDGYDHAPTNQPGGMPAGSSTGRNNSLTEDGNGGAAAGMVGNFE